MAIFSHYPLQKAVYQRFSGDSALMALVTGVFDRPPQGQDYPYVTIGDSTISDWSTKTSNGTEQQIAVHIWSRDGGRKKSEDIAKIIHGLLHGGNMSVEEQTLVLLRFISSAIVLENDGYTYHAILRFKALLEAN